MLDINTEIKTAEICTNDQSGFLPLFKTVEQTLRGSLSSASSATWQTIDPFLVSTKTNGAYRLCREAMVKNYQAYKDSCMACCSWPKNVNCSVLARNLFKGVHDEIHNIKKPVKPCLLKYFKWLLSHQRQRAGQGLASFPGRRRTAWQLPRVQTVTSAAWKLAVPIKF